MLQPNVSVGPAYVGNMFSFNTGPICILDFLSRLHFTTFKTYVDLAPEHTACLTFKSFMSPGEVWIPQAESDGD